ncbi:hypothetical protein Daudx_1965 [Candidatus Desulforudis audaxviator]|nr:hypothetical protein Daudx_1965 [Candidatus Desulforudis audaxviator]
MLCILFENVHLECEIDALQDPELSASGKYIDTKQLMCYLQAGV